MKCCRYLKGDIVIVNDNFVNIVGIYMELLVCTSDNTSACRRISGLKLYLGE